MVLLAATLVSYESLRPVDDAERKRCINAANALLLKTGLKVVIAKNIELNFRSERETYELTYSAHTQATGTLATAAESCAAASGTFKTALREWRSTLLDSEGRIMHGEIYWLLGGRNTSAFLEMTLTEQLVEMKEMFDRLVTRPALSGDAARLAALHAAYEVLDNRVAVLQVAEKAVGETALPFAAATRAFDLAWGVICRVVKRAEGPERAKTLLPVFHRTRKAKKGRGRGGAGTTPVDTDGSGVPETDTELDPPEEPEVPEDTDTPNAPEVPRVSDVPAEVHVPNVSVSELPTPEVPAVTETETETSG